MTSISNPAQFRLRHLLMVMLVSAIVSAVLAPWIRDLTRGQWLRLAVSLGLTVVAFASVSLLHAKLYLRARRQLGTIVWEVTGACRGPGKGVRILPYYFLAIAALMAFVLSAFSVAVTSQEMTGIVLLLSFQVGSSAAMGIQWLRCPLNIVLLGENGFVFSTTFTPWDKVWCSWERGGKPTPLLLKTSGWAVYELDVSADYEESVGKYRQSRARRWENPWRPK
jgi:hypothetical protein